MAYAVAALHHAPKLLKKRMAEMGKGKLVGPSEESVTLKDLKDMHLTDLKVNGRRLTWAETAWKHLTEHLGGMRTFAPSPRRPNERPRGQHVGRPHVPVFAIGKQPTRP